MRLPVICFSVLLAASASGQGVPKFGFDHLPLGQAQLGVGANGNLVVSNIGSSGLDGVRTPLVGSEYHTVMFGASDTQRGDFMELRTDGDVAGVNQGIWSLEVENLGTSFGVTMVPGPIGLQSARVLAWNDGVLVADTPVSDPAPGIIIVEVPPFGCDVDPVWPMGPIGPFPPIFDTWALFDLEQPGTVFIPSGFQALSVIADRVAIAVQHSEPIGALTQLEMRAKNVSQFEICEQTLGWKHHGHLARGEAMFDISNGFLRVANIGSSGLDGVCIDFDALANQTTDNGLEVPLQPVPIGPGQGMALEAYGMVQGASTQLGTSEIKRAPGGQAEVFAEFSSLGGTQVCVMGLLDGQEVLNTIVPQGAIGAFQEPVVLNSCGKLPPDFEPFPPIGPIIIIGPQPPCYLWGLDGDTDLEIYNGFDAQGSQIVTVDELRLLAVDVPPVDGLGQFDIRGTGLGQMTLLDEIPMAGNAWDDLGCADPGSLGDPILGGWGTLTPGSPNIVEISNGLPLSPSALFLSFEAPEALLAVPFKGGTLKAFPFLDMILAPLDASGGLALPFTWPTGLPAGVTITLQSAIQDPGASKGVALSNAIQGTTH